jgi:four helix bundle protein
VVLFRERERARARKKAMNYFDHERLDVYKEGAGEYSDSEKIRFYRMARRSATECASIFDICQQLQIINEKHLQTSRELLLRIVAMLTKMSQ